MSDSRLSRRELGVDQLLRAFSVFVLLFVLTPLICVLVRSVADGNTFTLRWYWALWRGVVPEAWRNTAELAATVGIVGSVAGFISALNWWERGSRTLVLAAAFSIAALPGTLYAVALAEGFRWMGLHRSSGVILGFAHFLLVLPFCTVIVMAGMTRITASQISAALELSGNKRALVVRTIILPVVWPSVVSAFVVGFLISANDYVRTAYLSGPTKYLSKYVHGQMSSGANPATYALGGTNVIVAALVVAAVVTGLWLIRTRVRE